MSSTASASLFLFDAAERSSLGAATEAAVQDIACEILEAEDRGNGTSSLCSAVGEDKHLQVWKLLVFTCLGTCIF